MTSRKNTSRNTLLALGLVLGVIGLSLAGWRVGASEYGQRLSERLHQPSTAQQVERLKAGASRSLALLSASASAVTPPSALLYTADYTVTTTATNIVVTDVSGTADTLTVSQPSAGNIKFAAAGRNFSVDGGADILGDSGTLTRSGITSITVNASADTINLGGFTGTLPSLSATGTNFNAGAIPLNTNSALTVNVTGTTSAITGIISGTGASLTKGGTGRLTLSSPANTNYTGGVPGSNTYTGTTTVNAGTLILNSGFVTAYNGGAIAINGASTFRVEGNRYDFTNKSFTFDATGGGTLDFSALGFGGSVFFGPTNVTANGGATNNIIGVNTGINTHLSATFNFNVAAGSGPTDLAVSALLWNGGSIVKDGPGILTLSYANTYAGTTTVNAGKLLVTGSLSAGGGGVSVNNTGTLGGTGTVNRVVTVNAGGFVAPGLSVGILNTSNVNFTSGSNFAVEIAGNGGAGDANGYDQLNVTGSATINNAALSLNFAGLTAGELSLGQTFVILNNDSTDAVTGTFAGLAEGATVATNVAGSGKDLKISYVGGTGNDVVLTVALSPCTPPAITAQPSGLTLCAGSPASFSVGATGTGLSYQWRKGGMAIGGATAATFSIAAAAAGDAGSYDVVVTGTCGAATSTAATLTVNATTALSTQPAGATKIVGQSMNFSVAATGTGLSYQWRKGGVAIGGANASSYSISFVTLGDAGNYDVVVSGACGNVTSDAATLTVNCPTITLSPATIPAGTVGLPYLPTSFSATGGNSTITFSLSGTLPTGMSFVSGQLADTPTQAGSFPITITATDAYSCSVSQSYTLVVNCPDIIVNPSTIPIAQNNTAYPTQTFTATGGNAPYTFSLAGAVPAGMSFSGGALSGTPTAPGDFSLTINVTDNYGCTASRNLTLTINRKPVAVCQNVTVTSDANCTASADINNGSSDADGDTLTITQSSTGPFGAGPYAVGTHTVTLTVDDGRGGVSTCTATVTVNAPKPVPSITGPASGSIYQVGTPINFAGTFTDLADATHTASWKFDTVTAAGTVIEPAGTTPGTASVTRSFTTAGVYLVTLTVTNNCGGSGAATTIGVEQFSALVVIYDPGAGFVTGGGWINSPAGAYTADPLLTGKANFGFVSKYHNGASVPTGNTEFQFKAGNLNFKSTVYEWLVVAGARAQYKGSGKINNAGDYRFMLTAIDGQVNGGGGTDKFRIRIWNNAGGGLVYDNQLNEPDSNDPTTLLGGGSIVIHK